MMKDKTAKDLAFALYMIIALILAMVYYTVPERTDFIDFQMKWWKEFLTALAAFF